MPVAKPKAYIPIFTPNEISYHIIAEARTAKARHSMDIPIKALFDFIVCSPCNPSLHCYTRNDRVKLSRHFHKILHLLTVLRDSLRASRSQLANGQG